jgi:basic membrane protein A
MYVQIVKDVMAGTWKPSEIYWGFEKDAIKLSPFNASVPDAVKQKVTAQMDLLKKGEDNIFAGPLKDQSGKEVIPAGKKATDQDLLTMRWLLEGVSGTLPD